MSDYQILPFRFTRFNDSEYLLTNDVGEYIFLRNEDFEKFIKKELDVKSTVFQDIASKHIHHVLHFVCRGNLLQRFGILADE